jgi:hypothetical protein
MEASSTLVLCSLSDAAAVGGMLFTVVVGVVVG